MYGRAVSDGAAALFVTGKLEDAAARFETAHAVYTRAIEAGKAALEAVGAGRESIARAFLVQRTA